jgi:hypothetical protein
MLDPMIARTSIYKMAFTHTSAYLCNVSHLIEYSTTELTDTVFRLSSDILLITGCISYVTIYLITPIIFDYNINSITISIQ